MGDVTLRMGTPSNHLTRLRDRARTSVVGAEVDLGRLHESEHSRELSIAITKQEEASMWLFRHLNKVGEV